MKTPIVAFLFLLISCGCDAHKDPSDAPAKPSLSVDTSADSSNGTNDSPGSKGQVLSTPRLQGNLAKPVVDLVALAQRQVGDGVLVQFIANIQEDYRLDADQIGYLHDLGLSSAVIEALLAHQAQLHSASVNSGTNGIPAVQAADSALVNSNSVAVVTPVPNPSTTPTIYPGGNPPPSSPQVDPAVPAPSSVATNVTHNQYFYDSLAPYGNWITVPTYGVVWQPSCTLVTPDWRPYWTNGSWVWSDSGWYWNSYYSWGWAPFHYGNWFHSPGYGWCWAPGSVWGPSWVTFRYSGGYCGWAPLPPGCAWRSGVGLTWAGNTVGVGFSFSFGAANYCWTPTAYFCGGNYHRHRISGAQASQVYNNSTVINNYVVGNNNTVINGGIDPGHISKASRSEIRKVQLTDTESPRAAGKMQGSNLPSGAPSRLAVYRPTVGPDFKPTAARQTFSPNSGQSVQLPNRPSTSTQPNPALAKTPALAGRTTTLTPNSPSGPINRVVPGGKPSSSTDIPRNPNPPASAAVVSPSNPTTRSIGASPTGPVPSTSRPNVRYTGQPEPRPSPTQSLPSQRDASLQSLNRPVPYTSAPTTAGNLNLRMAPGSATVQDRGSQPQSQQRYPAMTPNSSAPAPLSPRAMSQGSAPYPSSGTFNRGDSPTPSHLPANPSRPGGRQNP